MSDTESKGTILVLDDEEPIRRNVKRALELYGYQVLQAADAHAALGILSDHDGDIDLILCDLVLPGLGGREAANTMMARRPDAKIVFMSGYSSHASGRRDVLQAGEPFLGKPFEIQELVEMVERVLSE